MGFIRKALSLLLIVTAVQVQAEIEDVGAIIGEQGMVPQRFTKTGALVGAYHWIWHEPLLHPSFVFFQGKGSAFDLSPEGPYHDTDIIDVLEDGTVVGQSFYEHEPWSEFYRGFVARGGSMALLGTQGANESCVADVNNAGQIAGTLIHREWDGTIRETMRKAVLWNIDNPDQPIELMTSPSEAVDIDEKGDVVLNGFSNVSGSMVCRPFLWRQGSLFDLSRTFDFSDFISLTPAQVRASRLGDDGGLVFTVTGTMLGGAQIQRIYVRVSGKTYQVTGDLNSNDFQISHSNSAGNFLFFYQQRLYLWKEGKTLDLYALAGTTVPAVSSVSSNIHSSHDVVVFPTPHNRWFAYTNDSTLHEIPLGAAGLVTAVSDRGHVVGYYSDNVDQTYASEEGTAFLWKDGKFRLVNVPAAAMSWAWAVNNAGDVLGEFRKATTKDSSAFLYRRGQVRELGLSKPWALIAGNDGQMAGNFGTQTLLVTEDLQVVPDTYYAVKETLRSVWGAGGVLGNDHGFGLTASLEKGPAHGVLTLRPNGSFDYMPNPGFQGEDRFAYTASDGTRVLGPVEATITVKAENIPPIANAGPDIDAAVEDDLTQVVLIGSGADADDEESTLSYKWSQRDSFLMQHASLNARLRPGTHLLRLTVRDPRGGVGHDFVQVRVRYLWSGLLSPQGGSTIVQGTTVPVRFRLQGDSYTAFSLYAKGPDGVESLVGRFRYNSTERWYSCPWKTESLLQGIYRLRIDLGDDAYHAVNLRVVQAE